jgi:predicted ATP-grasp superfamily ATP-dependent carboligase
MADILVVGLSARALAQSAWRAGYSPLAADFFCDLDLQEAAVACAKVEGSLLSGLEEQSLLAALNSLGYERKPIGIAWGAGFEDRSALLDSLAARWSMLGNSAAKVRRAKDPGQLAPLCTRLGLPHPDIRFDECTPGFVRKQLGGSGGAHVNANSRRSDSYWQRRVKGDPVSALVLGSGSDARLIGLSSQWNDPAPGAPFRYGGAARPPNLPERIAAALGAAAIKVITALELVGLNSVDFLVAEENWHLIEVNPRPGATLDIFDSDEVRLFALHIAACRGELPRSLPRYSSAAASRIVYAEREVRSVPEFDWPDWTADRHPPGASLAIGAPVCTVLSEADTADSARRLVEERGNAILVALGAG